MGYILGVAAATEKQAIIDLLSASKLPTKDLPDTLENFFVVTCDSTVIGVAGLEIYGSYGLLRSVAVDTFYRNKNVGASLLSSVEQAAAKKGLKALYLLTETAADYFTRNGYTPVSRDEVPETVKSSSEFSHVCPVSAVVMQKQLPA